MEGPSAEVGDAVGAIPDATIQISGNIGTNVAVETTERPVVCQLDPIKGMFQVLQSKGKALSSGGFGVFIRDDAVQQQGGDDHSIVVDKEVLTSNHDTAQPLTVDTNTKAVEPRKSSEYLFVEEALFLHERGLLHALSNIGTPFDSSELFQLLPKLGISIPIYLVYAHLRSQDFRVLRHNPDRITILREQNDSQQHDQLEGKLAHKNSNQHMKRRIRETVQKAPPPTIHQRKSGVLSSSTKTPTPISDCDTIQICWDAYNPSSNFGKTLPGLPAFSVAVTFFNVPLVRFSDLTSLIQGPSQGIPLKVATVSDSGTVVMFGVTGSGVPPICTAGSMNDDPDKDDNDNDNIDIDTNSEPS
jgi:hypothetical protein